MKRLFRRIEYSIVVMLLCLTVPARACLNDRDSDSLAEEAQGLPDVVQVITGRFPRNPPLFYQMRIARVQQELKKNPRNFPLYDDIAVAYDRLGNDNEAIRWIETKRKWLPPFNANNATLKEDWYRYYANAGTFQAHRWLRSGADRNKISEVVTARDEIARAMQIKPNAHFGREKYQLAAMEWMIYLVKSPNDNDYHHKITFVTDKDFDKPRPAIEGLSGLVVLGNAWESIDIFNALRLELSSDQKSTLALLAQLRCEELIKNGKTSLSTAYDDSPASQLALIQQRRSVSLPPVFPKDIAKAFHALRAEAESWQNARTNYMMIRLQQGRHPDTDKTFWNEYSNSAPPSLEQFTPESKWRRYYTAHSFSIWSTIFTFALPFWLIVWFSNKVRIAIKRHLAEKRKVSAA